MKNSWISDIQAVRNRAKWMLLLQRSSVLIALSLGLLLLLGIADFLLRLPPSARLTQLILLIGVFLYAIYKYIRPAILFRPTLTQIALRAESYLPNLRGHLATGLEFTLSGLDQQSPLAARSVADARRRATQTRLRKIIQPKRTITDAGFAVFALAAVVVLWLTMPSYASIAARRIFIPLSPVTWPKRTGVTSEITKQVYPTGRAFSLRCKVTCGFNDSMRVYAHYRIIPSANDPEANPNPPFARVLLTYQRGQFYERLIEPAGQSIELWFETDDDRTPTQTITLVPPPEIQSARLQIQPLPYARQVAKTLNIDLGSGHDDRGLRAPAILRGSTVQLHITFNKLLSLTNTDRPWQLLLGYETDAPEESALPVQVHPATQNATEDDRNNRNNIIITHSAPATAWVLEWTMAANVRLNPHLVDEYGIYGSDDAHFRLDMTEDRPPTVSITNPVSDQTVLPTAKIAFTAEARDDVRVGTLRIEAAVQNANQTNDDNQKPGSHPLVIKSRQGTTRVESLQSALALADIKVKPGDIVELTAVAADTFALDGETHPEVRSTPRQLRIISQAEFAEQIYRDLSAVRERAITIVADQNKLRERMQNARHAPTDEHDKPLATIEARDRREQARLSERIARQQEQLQTVRDRLTKNEFRDADLEQTLRSALEQGNKAGQSSEQSAADTAQAEQKQDARLKSPQPKTESPDEKQLRDQVDNEQKEVEQALSEMIDLLDRGEDAWGARRDIEKLLNKQTQIKKQSTEQLDKTRGRNLSELSQQEKEQLQKLAGDQQALSQKAQELIDDLHQRAEKAKKTNPDLAQAMSKAAKRADEGQLAQQMKAASSQLSQNQTSRAQSSQQSAAETLQSMLKQLEDTKKAHLERLSRQLAGLIESIKGLIADQQSAIDHLIQADHDKQYKGLDHQLITLNRNTYSVADMARQADKKFGPIADRLNDAAGTQEAAITYLRADPVKPKQAGDEEAAGLALLQNALSLAEEMQKKNERSLTQQKRQELKKEYLALLQRQNAFINNSRPFIESTNSTNPLSRRNRAEARRYAARQTEIRTDVTALAQKTQEIAQSPVFSASHRRIDDLAQSVIDHYRRGEIDPTVMMRQREIANILQALAQALDNDNQDDSEFKDNQQGGGGSGGKSGSAPQPLIPPAAQLRLLQGLQKTIYDSTRELSEAGNLTTDQKIGRVDEIGTSQKELVGLAQEVLKKLQQGNKPPPPKKPEQPKSRKDEHKPKE